MPRKSKESSKAYDKILKELKIIRNREKLKELEGELETEGIDDVASPMLSVDTSKIDRYGDPIDSLIKSRLKDAFEADVIAMAYVEKAHHFMLGNRYGKHSILIKKNDVDNEIVDLNSFVGSPITEVEINGEDYYKVRMLVSDIYTNKRLLARIPILEGKARTEAIHLEGAAKYDDWIMNQAPIPRLPNMTKSPKTRVKDVADIGYQQVE